METVIVPGNLLWSIPGDYSFFEEDLILQPEIASGVHFIQKQELTRVSSDIVPLV